MRKAMLVMAFCAFAVSGLAVAEDGDLVPNRLAAAEVGEWASYALPGGYVQKLTVVKRFGEGDEALITVRVDNIYDGKVVSTKEITEVAGAPFTAPTVPNEDGVTVAVRNESAKVKGKELPASVVEINKFLGIDHEDNGSVEWWTSPEVPVFGIIKKMSDGDLEWELVQYGKADPEQLKKAESEFAKRLAEESKKAAEATQKAVDAAKDVAKQALEKGKEVLENAVK